MLIIDYKFYERTYMGLREELRIMLFYINAKVSVSGKAGSSVKKSR